MKYWTKRTYNMADGSPVVKVYTPSIRGTKRQVIQFLVVDDNWEKAEAEAKAWISKN